MRRRTLNRFDPYIIGAFLITLILGLILASFATVPALVLLGIALALVVLELILMLVQWLIALRRNVA